MLHVICTRLCPGHLSVRVGDGSRRSEEIVQNLELRLWIRLYLLIFLLSQLPSLCCKYSIDGAPASLVTRFSPCSVLDLLSEMWLGASSIADGTLFGQLVKCCLLAVTSLFQLFCVSYRILIFPTKPHPLKRRLLAGASRVEDECFDNSVRWKQYDYDFFGMVFHADLLTYISFCLHCPLSLSLFLFLCLSVCLSLSLSLCLSLSLSLPHPPPPTLTFSLFQCLFIFVGKRFRDKEVQMFTAVLSTTPLFAQVVSSTIKHKSCRNNPLVCDGRKQSGNLGLQFVKEG